VEEAFAVADTLPFQFLLSPCTFIRRIEQYGSLPAVALVYFDVCDAVALEDFEDVVGLYLIREVGDFEGFDDGFGGC
jgi:hypothetical protein